MIKTPLEKEEQKTLVEYLYTLKRQGKILDFFAPMNEVKRPRMKGKTVKKMI